MVTWSIITFNLHACELLLGMAFQGVRWPSGLELRPATGRSMARVSLQKTFRFGTLAIPFTPLCQCLSEETVKAVGPFSRALARIQKLPVQNYHFSKFCQSSYLSHYKTYNFCQSWPTSTSLQDWQTGLWLKPCFYMVSVPGEVKDLTSPHWNV